jgi:predicted Rdx family selenoprotein
METIGAAALQYLSSLVYRPDAGIVLGMIPWTGVYWTDEIPDSDLILALPEEDCHQVFRIFCIRQLIWRRKQLSLEDQEFWESAKSRVPTCPVFHRLEPSRDIVRADRRIERQMDACEAALEAEAEANKDAEEPA